jgi:hypothetical protein
VFSFVFAVVGHGSFVSGPRVASCPWAEQLFGGDVSLSYLLLFVV